MTDIARDFALAQQQSLAEAASITDWYQLRRNQAMMELERLENAYNERMAEHSVKWAQRLSNFMIEQGRNNAAIEQEMLQGEAEQERGNTYTTSFSSLLHMAKPTENGSRPAQAPDTPSVKALPIPRLERQTNVQYHLPANMIEEAIPIPDLWDPDFIVTNTLDPQFLYGPHTIAPVVTEQVVAIVSDDEALEDEALEDEGSDEETDYAMDIC